MTRDSFVLAAGNELLPVAEIAEVGDVRVPWCVRPFEDDYKSVRHGAALIDLSGGGLIRIWGQGASDLIDHSLTREVSYMTPDRTMMGMLLLDDGAPLDVVTLYRVDDSYLVQTSVGRGSKVFEVLSARAGGDVDVTDETSNTVIFGIEGPQSIDAVGQVLAEPVDGLPFQAARETSWAGGDLLVSRTGVTGEFGFAVVVDIAQATDVWSALARVADPVGFEAVEATMIEVRQPVLERELLEGDTVISAGLNWLVDIQKESFAGRDALMAQYEAGSPTARISFVADGEVRRGDEIRLDDEPIGDVVHATRSLSLDGYCGVGRVDRSVAVVGLTLVAGSCAARSTSSPIVTPTSWKALQA